MKKFFACLYLLFLTSCVAESPMTDHLSDTDKPALHAIQSQRLKSLMHELNDLMFERMLNEVQIDRQRRYRTEEIVRIAEKLLNTVEYIPRALQDLSLVQEEQQIFLKLSEKLKQQVILLKLEAENNQVDLIPKRANEIVETCNACHHVLRQYNK